jgi:hypothetical protein
MRWFWLLLVALTMVSCAPSREARLAAAEERVNLAKGRTISDTAGSVEPGTVKIHYTLLDLDDDAAKRLGIADGPSDVSPRRYGGPMGELVAVAVMEQNIGSVLDCGQWTASLDETLEVKSTRRVAFLRDWHTGDPEQQRDVQEPVPQLDAIEDGFSGTIKVSRADTEYSINLETTSMQLMRPIPRFDTSLGPGNHVFIDIPNVVAVRRVAAETVRAGETAAFQLSRDGAREARIRLLFLRIADSDS